MTINTTIEGLDENQAYHMEQMLRKHYKVKDFKVLPNTQGLYDNDPNFRNILKAIKEAQRVKDRYINDNRDKL